MLVLVCCIVLHASVFAVEQQERKLGVFFCTCDLASSDFSGMPSNKSLAGYEDTFIVVYPGDTDRHKQLRHCFLLLASEIKGILENRLVLDMAASAGYYYDPYIKKESYCRRLLAIKSE